MLVHRNELIKYLEKKFIYILLEDKPLEKKMYDYAMETYNYSYEKFSDYVSDRKSILEASDVELFVMADSFFTNNEEKGSWKKGLSDFFTQKEIHDFNLVKFDDDPTKTIKWPLKFDMIQIEEDQWIGRISINEMYKLMNNNLINYNPETQRAMTKIQKNSKNFYKITIDKNAIEAIKNDILEDSYIPSDITLNIPKNEEFIEEGDDTDKSDFYYDKEKKQLIIKYIYAFDINDGYHRYLALLNAKREYPECDQVMELRITNFNVEKSQRYIYQQAQKTKMSKSNTDSYNTNDLANNITNILNESPLSNIKGMIGRYNTQIDFAVFSDSLRRLYFRNLFLTKDVKRKLKVSVSKDLIEDFNMLTEADDKFLTMTYSKKDIIIILSIFYLYQKKQKDNMVKDICKVMKNKCKLQSQIFYNVGKISIKKIQAMIEEV